MAVHNKLNLHKVEQLLQSQIANRPPLLCFVVNDIPCNFKCAVVITMPPFKSIVDDYSKQF